ncbi:hypothetical protein I2I11_13920 [Pontibacter sp. 172403-2]|uniref:hypothetical protein n=1 Tax=Pontibacter rufus TaxID=2791028 RepID=UPI0018AFB7CF|nr:hypothetical protein [Pontibacter sp. 172403-2]MBF9254397.1 hypothetical protein [Pontibacter sp. 172403-2]
MENNASQNQQKNQDNTKSSQSEQKHGSDQGGVLSLLQPHDMSKTVESALHVFQGNHEKLPDLMQDVGIIISKATKRFTTTQLILTAGALTIGAILLARYSTNDDYEYAEAS